MCENHVKNESSEAATLRSSGFFESGKNKTKSRAKRGKPMYSFNSRVRYSEVNSEKELTLPSLLDYLQDCCTFESEDFGVGVDYLAKEQVAWILSSWEIKVYRYPQMGQHIKVSTWPYAFRGFYGYRNFCIEGEDGEIFAEANSVWVFMDTEKMRPARVSERMQEVYIPEIRDEIPGEWADRKISLPDEAVQKSVEKEPVRVSRFYIDTNHHMNNGKYILVAEEYLPEQVFVCGLRAEYRKAAMLGDMLYPVVTMEEKQITVTLADEKGASYAIICFQIQKKERQS